VNDFVTIAKALGDESRARALMALTSGELCLCQVIELLGLSPSTVSKHMSVLQHAGLIERRKDGRWHYYRLVGKDAPPVAREAIRWARRSLADKGVIFDDTEVLCCVREKDPKELAACYTTK